MTLLPVSFAVGSSVLICGMYFLKRRSDPYSIAVTCLPMSLLSVFLTSLWGARTVVHGFAAMADTGAGLEEAISGIELGNRAYYLGHVASGVPLIALVIVGVVSLFGSEATANRSSLRARIVVAVAAISTVGALTLGSLETRNVVDPLAALAALTQQDVSDMPMTLEAGRALEAEGTDESAGRVARNLLLQTAAAFVLFWLSVLGFVASVVLGRGTATSRPVAALGLALTAVATVIVCLQAYRHHALGDEIAQLANAQGTHQRQD